MPEWFIMVAVGSRLMFVGPFRESECQLTKELLFSGRKAVCIERSLIDGKQRPA